MEPDEGPTAATAELKERLQRLRHERRLSVAGLERRAGLGHTTVSQALNGSSIPSEATITALAQALRTDPGQLLALRRQASAVAPTRVRVTARITSRTLAEDQADEAIGTPVCVQHGRDTLLEEALLTVTVINEEKEPLQIVAFAVESLEARTVSRVALIPEALPALLDPRTRIVLRLPKEPIDNEDAIIFIGVIDALGRRHGLSSTELCAVARASWGLPSRVQLAVRRDDPTYFIRAYKPGVPTELTKTTLPNHQDLPEIIATRAMFGLPLPDYFQLQELGQLAQERKASRLRRLFGR